MVRVVFESMSIKIIHTKQVDVLSFFFYQINLHRKDQALLEQVKKFFNVGNIYNSPTASRYYVSSVKDLQIITQHFDKYPLASDKRADYLL